MVALEPSHLSPFGSRNVPDNQVVPRENRGRACRPVSSFRSSVGNLLTASLVAAGAGRARRIAQTTGARMGCEHGSLLCCRGGCCDVLRRSTPLHESKRCTGRPSRSCIVDCSNWLFHAAPNGDHPHIFENRFQQGRPFTGTLALCLLDRRVRRRFCFLPNGWESTTEARNSSDE